MNFYTRYVLFFVSLFAASAGAAIADTAWWHLCSGCQSQNDYRIAAISAGSDEEAVFVSNPEALETRKFQKFVTWEDFGNGMVRMTHVMEVDLTQQEQVAFRDALEKSQTVFSTVDSDLVDAYAGIPPHPSALFAIRNGRLGNSFFFGLQASINAQGLLPTRESVGASAGVNIGRLSGNVGSTDSIRLVPLALRVQYPDGSHINAVYNPDGTWSDVSVVDIEGNTIDVDVDASLNAIVVASLIGDYMFSGENLEDAINDFIQAVGRSTRPATFGCRSETLPDGTFRLICGRL